MASRQEEKEARRLERQEAEAREAKAAARNRRLQLVLGGVLGALIIAGVVIGIAASGGDDKKSGGGGTPTQTTSNSDVKLPEQQTADPAAASDAAGCKTINPPNEGRSHEEKVFTEADYKQNPPTSGTHFPQWAQDGIYAPGKTPQLGETVHTLEHGRIDIQYKPGTDQKVIDELEAFVGENDGYHMLLFENNTKMDAAVAATAWDWQMTCPSVNDKTWDALRTFRDEHLDKGPEKIP